MNKTINTLNKIWQNVPITAEEVILLVTNKKQPVKEITLMDVDGECKAKIQFKNKEICICRVINE